MVRTSSLRGYMALMTQLGGDPITTLRRFRISPKVLEDEDALLPLRSVTNVLEASAVATGCPDFGLRLARVQDISVLGPLAVAMQNAPTVADALNYASRYLSVQSPGLVLSIHRNSPIGGGAVELRVEVRLLNKSARRQVTDLSLADLHHMLKLLAGREYVLRAATLPYSTAASLSTYSRFFDAPVLVEQPFAGLHVTVATLEAKVATVNSSLRKIAVDYLVRHAEAPDRSFSELVRQTLPTALGTELSTKQAVAGLLGLHPRTLQRYLAGENTSFDQIRDQVRRDLALRYLRETRIPLAQLASILGMSEQSALTRACRRWFGVVPSRLRGQSADNPVLPRARRMSKRVGNLRNPPP